MVQQLSTVQEALTAYDKELYREHIETAERERDEILRRFPLQEWPTLPLEHYALGQLDSSETYCYWLEFGAAHLGSMRGGSAVKHVIYKHKNKPGWYYPNVYSNEQEAWEVVRAAFVQAFELAQTGIVALEDFNRRHIYFREQVNYAKLLIEDILTNCEP